MERTVNYLCDLCRLKQIEDPKIKRALLRNLRINPPSNDEVLNRFYRRVIDDLAKAVDEEIKQRTKGKLNWRDVMKIIDEVERETKFN